MSQTSASDELLAAFGRQVGLSGLRFDEEGYAVLAVDESVIVNMERDGTGNSLLLYSAVGQVDGRTPAAYARLLEANYLFQETGGGALGLAPDTGRITLALWANLAGLDLAGFEGVLSRFVGVAEHWTAQLAEWEREDAAASEAPPGGQGVTPLRV